MPITDIPILSMLRERMQWHQARQQVLAENVANADTPNYQAQGPGAAGFLAANCRPLRWHSMRTDPDHIAGARRRRLRIRRRQQARYEIRPRGNSVSHEDEMMKVASNQMDYEAVTSLYTHSLALIKLAIGR